MSFLNPMTYVRGAANAGKAIAGRSYYEFDETVELFDAPLDHDDRPNGHTQIEGKGPEWQQQ